MERLNAEVSHLAVEFGVRSATDITGFGFTGHALALVDRAGLDDPRRELLADPQTSGGLLLAAPPERAAALLAALRDSGQEVAEIGEVLEGPLRIEIV